MQNITEPITLKQEFNSKLLDNLNKQFEAANPDRVLSWGFKTFRSTMVLGTGFGPSGIFLIDRLQELGFDIPVFYLDTHLLFDETYELRDRIEELFNIRIIRVSTGLSLREQAEKYGEELWKTDPNHCCFLRKVLPLRNYLSDKKAWITGVRRSQSETRRQTQFIEWDPENEVVKINPLANRTDDEVWNYIHEKGLPYNPLHDDGYPSIGCVPCTQPIGPDEEDKRNGRWNGSEKTECGIHVSSQNFQNGFSR